MRVLQFRTSTKAWIFYKMLSIPSKNLKKKSIYPYVGPTNTFVSESGIRYGCVQVYTIWCLLYEVTSSLRQIVDLIDEDISKLVKCRLVVEYIRGYVVCAQVEVKHRKRRSKHEYMNPNLLTFFILTTLSRKDLLLGRI